MSSIQYTDVDAIWDILGRFGPYQVSQVIVLGLAYVPLGYHVLSSAFLGQATEHTCIVPVGDEKHGVIQLNESAITVSSCSVTVGNVSGGDGYELSCSNGFNYSQPRESSFVAEWDLVCEREALGHLAQTLLMAGMLCGASLLSPLTDRFGRKPVHIVSHIGAFGVCLLMAFVYDFKAFLALKFMIGLLKMGSANPAVVAFHELFQTSCRSLVGLMLTLLWSVSMMSLTGVAYLARNHGWRFQQIVLSAFSAFSVLEIWVVNSMTYYGLALLSSQLSGDIYVNFLLGALLEIPADVLLWIMCSRVGRKKTCIFFHLFGGLSLSAAVLSSALAGQSSVGLTCQRVFSLLGRFAIAGGFNTLWLYTPEVFPTNARALGLGLAGSVGRIGSMVSPFLSILGNKAVWAPGAIFSVAYITVTGLFLLLPETMGRELPQTVDDVRKWKEKQRVAQKKSTE